VLDEMAAAMNVPADSEKDASEAVVKQPKPAPAPKFDALAVAPVANGLGTR
jgi:hypothetical protein